MSNTDLEHSKNFAGTPRALQAWSPGIPQAPGPNREAIVVNQLNNHNFVEHFGEPCFGFLTGEEGTEKGTVKGPKARYQAAHLPPEPRKARSESCAACHPVAKIDRYIYLDI